MLLHCDGFTTWTDQASAAKAGKAVPQWYSPDIGTTGAWPTNSNGRWGAGSGSFRIGTDYGNLQVPQVNASPGATHMVYGVAFAPGGWWQRGQMFTYFCGIIFYAGVDYSSGPAIPYLSVSGAGIPVTQIPIPSTWMYLEAKVSASYSEVRIDGVTRATGTGGGFASAGVQFGGYNSNHMDATIADLYILDSVGTPNDFLGNVRIETLTATSEGTDTGWTLAAGASKTAAVSELVPEADEDADYLTSNVPNATQTFQMSDLVSSSGTIHGVRVNARMRKESSIPRGVAPVIRLGSDIAQGVVTQLPETLTYSWFGSSFGTKPAGGAWTIADVNALQAGVRVTS